MDRKCLKCGAVKPNASGDPLEECPQCGAIYSRTAAQAQVSAAPLARRFPKAADVPSSDQPDRGALGWIAYFVEILAWVGVIVGASAGYIQLIRAIDEGPTVTQQGVGAVVALGYVVIPYCLARAVHHLRHIR